MTISYQWLKDYLADCPPVEELSRILTSIGLEVEAVERAEAVKGGLAGLVIGHVLTREKHPNADKLSVTTVDVGGDTPLKIVCGAPNVAAGQKVVVATVGTTVHPTHGEAFLIKKAKIRGEESEGMICAEDEIGLGDSHAGIMILPEDAQVGMAAKTYFNIPETDFSIHIGLTPNRSDANSHIGVARDVCAYLAHHKGIKNNLVMPASKGTYPAAASTVTVTIEAAAACPRYTGVYLTNVMVGDSPEWLKQRLQAIGVRSINNIVDITNYVLHEYGQPLHAFDADKLKGNKIIVKHLPEGTPFLALDEKERKLRASDLVICDAEGPVAIGGVFGGLHSGISDGTTNVFLESAYFDPRHIRITSTYFGLRTDAAMHFEKGVDINNVVPALQRAAEMIAELAGGKIASAITDAYPTPLAPAEVTISYEYLYRLAGKNYGNDATKEILSALGFTIKNESATGLTLGVPTNKPDVLQPADIVEEVLRVDGLDNVQLDGRLNIALTRPMPNDRKAKERMAELLCGMGMQEIVTNSIVNSKYYPNHEHLVRMINSLSAELDVMRPSMLESGLEVVAYNCNRKSQDLALFEFGNIYHTGGNGYNQEQRLALWVTGNSQPAQWNQKAQKADLYHVKGIISNLLAISGIGNATISYAADSDNAETTWKWKNNTLCTISRVSAAKLKEHDIKQDVFFADIHWDNWTKAMAAGKIRYSEVPKFPAVVRDLAIVLDKEVTYKQVADVTEKLKIDSLQSFGLFDVFESEKLGAGKKSYALSYTLQLTDRTLTDAETEQVMKQLTEAYTNQLKAQIRL